MNTTPDAQTLSFSQLHARMETLERVALLWTEEQNAKERAAEEAAARATKRREAFWVFFTQGLPIVVIVAGIIAVLFHLFAALELIDELQRVRAPAPLTINSDPNAFIIPAPATPRDWLNDDEHPFGDSPSRL